MESTDFYCAEDDHSLPKDKDVFNIPKEGGTNGHVLWFPPTLLLHSKRRKKRESSNQTFPCLMWSLYPSMRKTGDDSPLLSTKIDHTKMSIWRAVNSLENHENLQDISKHPTPICGHSAAS
ncbi:unnamed protein product [Orchesella dallaii]|uniref:Uncharacterized protein n=1 Tax=Orchesella dallaii TaxID=48710 RepID=A0ABP1RU65_9HEXA